MRACVDVCAVVSVSMFMGSLTLVSVHVCLTLSVTCHAYIPKQVEACTQTDMLSYLYGH